MLYAPMQIVTNQSMAVAITSRVIGLDQYFGYAVQADYTTSGTLGGILSLEASVDHKQDPEGNVLRAGSFVTVTDSPVLLTGAGSYIWNVRDSNYAYFRLVYTPTGGDTGTLNAYATIKGI